MVRQAHHERLNLTALLSGWVYCPGTIQLKHEAEDIAHMALFLLSDKASLITGQVIHVNGGVSAIML